MAHRSHGPDGSPPRRRRGRPPSLDRESALDATRRVIASRGLDRARYQDIAEESGVAVSTLQHAFGRLDEILSLALERSQQLDREFLEGLPTSADASAWHRMEAFLSGALASPLPSNPTGQERAMDLASWLVWVELWRASARDPSAAAQTTESYALWWSTAESIIRDGQSDGTFAQTAAPGDLAVALNALVDGLAVGLLLRPGGPPLGEAQRIAVLSARRLLGAQEPATT